MENKYTIDISFHFITAYLVEHKNDQLDIYKAKHTTNMLSINERSHAENVITEMN